MYVFFTDTVTFKRAILDTKVLGVFILLLIIGVIRNNLPNFTFAMSMHRVLSIMIYYLSTVHILKLLLVKNEISKVLNLILIPFFCLAILNILLFFLGITREVIVARDTSLLMSSIGISNFNRVNFYLVGGVNSYGTLNGVCLVLTVLSAVFKIHARNICYSFLSVFTAVAFFTDSRAALIFAIVSIILGIFYIGKNNFLWLNLAPYLTFFAPFIMFLIFPLLAEFDVLSSLSRGDNDLATGNSRFLIWAIIFDDLVNKGGTTLFGYGDGGLYLTSSFRLIADLFADYEDIVINSQNSVITVLVDFGLIAFIIFFTMLFKQIAIIKNFFKFNSKFFIVASSLIFYILLIGVTEALIGLYYQNAFVMFIYVFSLPFLYRGETFISKSK